jgi:Fungal specific transcription factor domain
MVDAQPTWALHTGQMLFHLRCATNDLRKSGNAYSNHYGVQYTQGDQYLTEPGPFSKLPPKGDGKIDWENERFRPPRFSDICRLKKISSQCKLCGRPYNLTCIPTLLPAKDICEKLCYLFFATVFPLIPILHLQSFGDDWRAFWEEADQTHRHDAVPGSLLRNKPSFVCLLSAILFATLASASTSRLTSILGQDAGLAAEDMYFAAMVSATLTGFPRRPTIYSLAAYVFAQSQFVREEEFSDSPDFINTSFRISLGMGLHRDLPGASFTTAERETRRRLWWYILHLDVMSSASSGLSPLFIDDKMANTPSISLHDHDEYNSESIQSQCEIEAFSPMDRLEISLTVHS